MSRPPRRQAPQRICRSYIGVPRESRACFRARIRRRSRAISPRRTLSGDRGAVRDSCAPRTVPQQGSRRVHRGASGLSGPFCASDGCRSLVFTAARRRRCAVAASLATTPAVHGDDAAVRLGAGRATRRATCSRASNFTRQQVTSYTQLVTSPLVLEPGHRRPRPRRARGGPGRRGSAPSSPLNTSLINVTVTDENPAIAAAIADAIADAVQGRDRRPRDARATAARPP